ncbi:MAG: T9SS type A sorting domain-containing protein [Saprospiraceae bacterium]|nr:T9SS type A sorting domain-containing protein [Saprospiraceae bacterium]
MKRIYFIALLILGINWNAYACSCVGPQSFCESTIGNSNIAIVEVISVNEEDFSFAFDVKVESILSGTIEEEKLSINYSYSTCTDVVRVELGDKLIINFNDLSSESEAPFPTIHFSICSVNYILIQNGNVVGEINSSETESLPIHEFLKNFDKCLTLENLDFEESLFSRFFSVKINPIINTLFLKIPSSLDEEIKIDIYNNLGQRLHSTSSFDSREKVIDLHHIPSGLYNCVFRYKSLAVSKKFVKI